MCNFSNYSISQRFVKIVNLSKLSVCQNCPFVKIVNVSKLSICQNCQFVNLQKLSIFKFAKQLQNSKCVLLRDHSIHCTTGDEGSVGIISCMSIFSACFVLLTSRQLAATTWSGQIWISCWILPHFDVRTISVAWKLKKLSNIFWQKIFFLLHPLNKGVDPLYNNTCF